MLNKCCQNANNILPFLVDGALGKFINYGYGSLQTLEGVQIHGKIVLGVHLDACAQLCLAETSFPCASFDYVYEEQSCQLSQYIAANVHGIRTEYKSRYQVTHYELIGKYYYYYIVHFHTTKRKWILSVTLFVLLRRSRFNPFPHTAISQQTTIR